MAHRSFKARDEWMKEARTVYDTHGDSRRVLVAVARARIAHARAMGFDTALAMRSFARAVRS